MVLDFLKLKCANCGQLVGFKEDVSDDTHKACHGIVVSKKKASELRKFVWVLTGIVGVVAILKNGPLDFLIVACAVGGAVWLQFVNKSNLLKLEKQGWKFV